MTAGRRSRIAAALALVGASLLSGCHASDAASGRTEAASSFEVSDAWIATRDDGMTGVYGVLENLGHESVALASATSPSAGMVEFHETVDDGTGVLVMRPTSAPFVVPAGGDMILEPGGDHLMLMEVAPPISAGDDISVSLVFEDGSTFSFTAQAKDFLGGDEEYVPMDHG